MDKLTRLLAAAATALFGLAYLAGCGADDGQEAATPSSVPWTADTEQVDGMRLPARVQGPKIALATDGGFDPRFWPGVNIGATIPGTSPGEVAARAEQYREWFPEMADLGVRVVRVYTLLDPSFYRELAAYNEAHPDAPLYVIHGVWIPEEDLLKTGDLWSEEVMSEQKRLTDEVYAAASGDFSAPDRLGEASGTWDTDIRKWIIGWSFGVELEPEALARSERRNPPRSYSGKYVSTLGKATSTEAWLADQLDYLSSLDAKAGWSRPVTFTNWLTLDPLDHPMEPLKREDLVSVDATHLRAERAWPGGLFASYHAYPYYPDFLRYEYADAEDPYAGYLEALRRYHGKQAVMITEFGVPSSLGKAHLGPEGRDQGGHDEPEAMAMDADMLRVIAEQGFAGGIVFEWIDEWFKLTWNTVELELPDDRRQMWRNPLTNEENFGLRAAEAGLESKTTIDGDDGEWESGDAPSQVIWESPDEIRQIRAAHDEAYLYLTLRFADPAAIDGTVLGLDVRDGDNRGLPWLQKPAMESADVALRFTPDGLEIKRAAWTDELAFRYGLGYGYVDVDPAELEQGSGSWHPPRMILNRPYSIPTTDRRSPVEIQDLGSHPWVSEAEDSLALGQRGDDVVELRIPWAFLGFSDPSSRTLLDPHPDGTIGTEVLPPERAIALEAFAADGAELVPDASYNFEGWQTVEWSSRPKAGIDQLADALRQTAEEGAGEG